MLEWLPENEIEVTQVLSQVNNLIACLGLFEVKS